MTDSESAIKSIAEKLANCEIIDSSNYNEEDLEEDLEQQQKLKQQLCSNNSVEILNSFQDLKRRASSGSRFMQLLRSPEAVAALISNLQPEADSKLQLGAAEAITNLVSASSSHVAPLTNSGAVKALVCLLQSSSSSSSSSKVNIQEQVCWAISNFISQSNEDRQAAIDAGLVPALKNILQPNFSKSLLDSATVLLVNIFRSRDPRVTFDVAADLLPDMIRMLRSEEAALLHSNIMWAVSFLIEDSEQRCQYFLSEESLSLLRQQLIQPDSPALVPTLRVLVNISSSMSLLPNCVLADDLLPKMRNLLQEQNPMVKRLILFFIANISDGPDSHLQLIIDAGLLQDVNQILLNFSEGERREAFWIVPNFCITRPPLFKNAIINNCLKGFVHQLTLEDEEFSQCILMTVRDLLNSARNKYPKEMEFDKLKQILTESGALKQIEFVQQQQQELQQPNSDLAKMSFQIIDQFFHGNEAKYTPPPGASQFGEGETIDVEKEEEKEEETKKE